jgi:hypothetical protein
MKRTNCIGDFSEYCMLIVQQKYQLLLNGMFLILLLFGFAEPEGRAQDNFIDEKPVISFSYDELPVLVMVEGFKSFYTDAIYANDDLLYVNVEELFKTLGIPCASLQKVDSLAGFIENVNRKYLIDFNSRQIRVGDRTVNTKNGLVREMGTIYMESSLFAEAFGITLTFNYRALTLILKADFELPVIKQQRIEKMRSNLSRIKGEEEADTVLKRTYHLFRFGMVDWSAASYQTWKGTTDNRFGLGVGTEFLKGEADISVNYYDQYKFDKRQLFYLWRWVDNDKKFIKQAQVGKISNQTISFINSPIVGAVIRNSPTTVRKATGYYTINEFTEPNWTIELYINNVMVDYTKADASGSFTFKVPIVYGYTTLKLMFYGPLGEERTEERTMNMPYTVMPSGGFEYGLSAGILQDSTSSRFGRGEFNYGINRFMTVGGGVEYLSSISNGSVIPFATTTIQPFSKMILTGEYAYGVRTRGLLDLYFFRDAMLEIDYARYVKGQMATRFNALEERKVKLTIPLRIKKFVIYSRSDYSQFLYEAFDYNQANVMFSAYYRRFSANSATQMNWITGMPEYVTSELALSYRLGKGFTVRPSARYNITESKFLSYKVAVEKSIPKGYFTFIYERNLLYKDHFISLNFRYDLNFARTNVSVSHNNGKMYTSESAQGSLAFGSGNNYIQGSNNPSVGRGGISLYPFLDMNYNGIFDKGEHMVKLTSVKITGSKPVFSEKDSIIRISDLNSFTSYIVEFNNNDLENIAWRFKHKRYQVLIDPNQFKRVDIPVIAVGEVSGMAYSNNNNGLKGIGRILVRFYKKNSTKVVAETLSESDGYIDYMGLEPGDYVARLDSVQMSSLDLKTDQRQFEFTIKSSEEGDIVSGIDFVLDDKKPQEKTVNGVLKISALPKQSAADSMQVIIGHMTKTDIKNQRILVWGELCDPIGYYYVQCGAFRYRSNAMRIALYIKQNTMMTVGIVLVNGLNKVQVGCVSSMKEVVKIKKNLLEIGVGGDLFIWERK